MSNSLGTDVNLLTIVIVCKNDLHRLQITLNSLVTSLPVDLCTVLIINGGTRIPSFLTDQYASLPLIIYTQTDSGIYNAMNSALPRIKTPWVYFLNCGDTISNATYFHDILFEVSSLPTNKSIVFTKLRKIGSTYDSWATCRTFTFLYLAFGNVCHQATLYRRNLFDIVGVFDEKYSIASDKELILRAFKAGIGFAWVPLCICNWEVEGYSSRNIKVFLTETSRLRYEYYNTAQIFLSKLLNLTMSFLARVRAQI